MFNMQTDLADTFHSRLMPLREAVDSVKVDLLDSMRQHLSSLTIQYRCNAPIYMDDSVRHSVYNIKRRHV